mmetsp:Transcript_51134/g.132782  ORF Transcript_51134/g.132782 Transcript_51134/m.132782 type:complete len:209 (-) Transcript_51134:120-746(-)
MAPAALALRWLPCWDAHQAAQRTTHTWRLGLHPQRLAARPPFTRFQVPRAGAIGPRAMRRRDAFPSRSGIRRHQRALVDLVDEVVRILALHAATRGLRGAQNLQNSARERLGERARAHDARNTVDLLERHGARVLDVLDLLAVTRGLLESLDHERSGRRHDLNLGLTVLHDELARHAQALPLTRGRLDDVIANLLRRHAERTDLGGQR